MSESAETSRDEAAPETGHETRDVRVAPIAYTAIGLAAIAASAFVVAAWLLARLESSAEKAEAVPSPMTGKQAPPAPQLQSQPRDALEKLQREEIAKLDGYHWIDRERKVVQVPIERAMEVLAERGFPEPQAPPMPISAKEPSP
jgi:hypothetical protein